MTTPVVCKGFGVMIRHSLVHTDKSIGVSWDNTFKKCNLQSNAVIFLKETLEPPTAQLRTGQHPAVKTPAVCTPTSQTPAGIEPC